MNNPTEYLLHIRTVQCGRCAAVHTTSETFLATHLSGTARKLQPVTSSLDPGIPLVVVSLPKRTVPICHACVTESPITDANATRRWQETLMRKLFEATEQPQPKAPRPIEDLA
jgi:hypothetical protein